MQPILILFVLILAFMKITDNAPISKVPSKEMVKFMKRYGYLPETTGPESDTLYTEKGFREVIKQLQKFGGLPETGQLDENTLKLTTASRCGVPDVINGFSNRKKRFSIASSGWRKRHLTYFLSNWGDEIEPTEVLPLLEKAFKVWSDITPLNFSHVRRMDADIIIAFGRGAHGDMYPFDGPGNTLAHAYFPYQQEPYGGDIHFDDDEMWVDHSKTTMKDGVDLFTVATHEIGHSLGLAHSSAVDSVMFPYYKGYTENFRIGYDDILGMYDLYVRNQMFEDNVSKNNPSRKPNTEKPIPPEHPTDHPRKTSSTLPTSENRPTRKPTVNPDRTANRPDRRPNNSPRKPEDKPSIPDYHPKPQDPTSRPENRPIRPLEPTLRPSYRPRPQNPTSKPRPTTPEPSPTQDVPLGRPKTTKRPTVFSRTTQHKKDLSTIGPTDASRTTPVYHEEEKAVKPNITDICKGPIDAISILRGELFLFHKQCVYRMKVRGIISDGYPVPLQAFFSGLPSKINKVDAVYQRPTDHYIILFTGNQYWKFSGNSFTKDSPRPISDLGLPQDLPSIDAAFVWSKNDKTYFFSQKNYWRYDESSKEIGKEYPLDIETRWQGIPSSVDSAFTWTDGQTYFLKGNQYWRFNNEAVTADSNFPRNSFQDWMGCNI